MINLAFYSDQIVPKSGAADERLLATMASWSDPDYLFWIGSAVKGREVALMRSGSLRIA
ncbi:hypothetical protein AGR6A_Cc150031 [Agrobacterium sp. NCPPB 925]|nr:hypothetical protein AGR6A_Cc150031 [Agrobacterium sp. NCPPB 925]